SACTASRSSLGATSGMPASFASAALASASSSVLLSGSEAVSRGAAGDAGLRVRLRLRLAIYVSALGSDHCGEIDAGIAGDEPHHHRRRRPVAARPLAEIGEHRTVSLVGEMLCVGSAVTELAVVGRIERSTIRVGRRGAGIARATINT